MINLATRSPQSKVNQLNARDHKIKKHLSLYLITVQIYYCVTYHLHSTIFPFSVNIVSPIASAV